MIVIIGRQVLSSIINNNYYYNVGTVIVFIFIEINYYNYRNLMDVKQNMRTYFKLSRIHS